ncbi:MAG: hypothetical protein OEZ22_05085 [Spirochaetia bacterium]|nr:hypothetical protein [Spirochaetia bacterium]
MFDRLNCCNVYIFGSRVTNKLADSNIPYKVNVIDWSFLSDEFKQVLRNQKKEPIVSVKY